METYLEAKKEQLVFSNSTILVVKLLKSSNAVIDGYRTCVPDWYKIFRIKMKKFVGLLLILVLFLSCKSTDRVENTVKNHFDDMKFDTYHASKEGSLRNIDTKNIITGQGNTLVDGKRTAYKYAITLDKAGNLSDLYFGSDGGMAVFMSWADYKDAMSRCSKENVGQPASKLFECQDAVSNKYLDEL